MSSLFFFQTTVSPRSWNVGLKSALRGLLHCGFIAAKGPSTPQHPSPYSPLRVTGLCLIKGVDFQIPTCLIWIGLFLLAACKPSPPPIVDPPTPKAGSVFILNEGNFQWGNASLDVYDPEKETLQSAIFQSANQQPLGDVLQSMEVFDDKTYLVVNNSGKIEVLDPDSLTRLGSIEGLTSPRYFLGISPQKAYVSDLYGNAIAVLDLEKAEIRDHIPLAGWTERMVLAEGSVFVSNVQSDYLYLIDPQSDQIKDSIRIRIGGSGIVQDKEGMLWVACGEILQANVQGALYRIDPGSQAVIDSFLFPIDQKPSELHINAAGDQLFFLNGGVQKMRIDATDLPSESFISAEGGLLYGLGIDPATDEIYVADAIDYVQKGLILRYNATGELVHEFRAGIIPGGFYFQEK